MAGSVLVWVKCPRLAARSGPVAIINAVAAGALNRRRVRGAKGWSAVLILIGPALHDTGLDTTEGLRTWDRMGKTRMTHPHPPTRSGG